MPGFDFLFEMLTFFAISIFVEPTKVNGNLFNPVEAR